MSQDMKYLTPKKPISEITRERAEQMEKQNIDVYEALAGLYEEFAVIAEEHAALKKRITTLEGGQDK